MPVVEEVSFASATGITDIYAKLWRTENTPVAILQIAHGMAEHIERYHDFASFMAENGVLVAANDHAGHGKSVGKEQILGYFGKQNGWDHVLQDVQTLHDLIVERYPAVPYILMGHSMGSFLARTYASRSGKGFAAFIFSGTSGKNPAVSVGKLVAKLEIRRNGEAKPSHMLHNMSVGGYNKAFAPARTGSDWLSRVEEQVDKYENDPLCGFEFTAEGMLDIFSGLEEISSEKWAALVPDIPILLMSGDHDPVGGNGKGVRQVYDWLKRTGHGHVTLRLYPDGRHEMLNESNYQEVYDDVLAFVRAAAQ